MTLLKSRPGLEVRRQGRVVEKTAHDAESAAALDNEARMLQHMTGSWFAPELLEMGCGYIVQTDVGETQAVQDVEVFRRNCIRMLYAIRQRRVRHGDITSANIIVRGDVPKAIDWQEAHFIGESASQKQPWTDSELLFRSLSEWMGTDTPGEYDLSRTSRRWRAVLGALGADTDLGLPLKGKTLLDLGCFQGDFCAAAATEGMRATGVDRGGFRTGEDSVAIGRGLWGLNSPWPEIQLVHMDIMEIEAFDYDVVLLFSTWSYVVQEYGRRAAEELLARIVTECDVLFFENQLRGDGPGPDFFHDDGDIETLLGRLGHVKRLATIPVWERPASRTVWEVRS